MSALAFLQCSSTWYRWPCLAKTADVSLRLPGAERMGYLGPHCQWETHLWSSLGAAVHWASEVRVPWHDSASGEEACGHSSCFHWEDLEQKRLKWLRVGTKNQRLRVNLENRESSDLGFSNNKPNNPEETINIQIDTLPIKTTADGSGADFFMQKAIMMGNRVRFRPICSKLGKSKCNHS